MGKYYAMRNKPDTERKILHDFTYYGIQKKQNNSQEQGWGDCQHADDVGQRVPSSIYIR